MNIFTKCDFVVPVIALTLDWRVEHNCALLDDGGNELTGNEYLRQKSLQKPSKFAKYRKRVARYVSSGYMQRHHRCFHSQFSVQNGKWMEARSHPVIFPSQFFNTF
jgi:hypothetical protein